MSSTRLLERREKLEGERRYHRLLLTPAFKKYLEQRKKMLQDKVPSSSNGLLRGQEERRIVQIYHLRYIAQDCKDWKTSDLEAIKRGMEVSILKYRLAKELAQEAREVLDDMLTDVYPYLGDPRGLEEKVWEVFDNEELSEADETERNEAERKLQVAGFSLPQIHVERRAETPPVTSADTGPEDDGELDDLFRRETAFVNQQTERLLTLLEEKKAQLENLRDLGDAGQFGSSSDDAETP